MIRRPPRSTLFPLHDALPICRRAAPPGRASASMRGLRPALEARQSELRVDLADEALEARSEEHTSELQSRQYLVCRLLLEKKKTSHELRSSTFYRATLTKHPS